MFERLGIHLTVKYQVCIFKPCRGNVYHNNKLLWKLTSRPTISANKSRFALITQIFDQYADNHGVQIVILGISIAFLVHLFYHTHENTPPIVKLNVLAPQISHLMQFCFRSRFLVHKVMIEVKIIVRRTRWVWIVTFLNLSFKINIRMRITF